MNTRHLREYSVANTTSSVVLTACLVNLSTDLNAHMRGWELLDKGFSYDVVAVFGSQSTGKSELIVRLVLPVLELIHMWARRYPVESTFWNSIRRYE